MNYLAQAKTDLNAIAYGEGIEWQTTDEKVVPVSVIDEDGLKAITAHITMNVSSHSG